MIRHEPLFLVVARDENATVCRGRHSRAGMDLERFQARLIACGAGRPEAA